MKNKTLVAAVSLVITAVLLITPCVAFAGSNAESGINTANHTYSDTGMNVNLSDEDGDMLPLSTSESASSVKAPKDKATVLPTAYSLVSENRVTSVKSQGSNGNCWAFSALASLESNYITNGFGTVYDTDFSESHLTWFTYHSYVSDNTASVYGDGYSKPLNGQTSFSMGGNFMLAAYTLAAGMGIASESSYPYVGTGVAYTSADRYAQSVVLSGMERYAETDKNSIKQALIDNGAMTLDFCYKNDSYCVNSSYYYSGSTKAQANHAVTLVGWDDNYSINNFSSSMRPTSKGAWLCKNSWGASDSLMDDGYFWISYSEPSLCDIASFTCEESGNYESVYQYDGFGYGSALYSDNCNTALAANIFKAEATEYLDKVSFYTDQFNVDYTVYIYKDLNSSYVLPTDGTLATTVSGNESNPGYHMVQLDKSVKIAKGTNFSVVVKYTAKNDSSVYIPVEGSSIPSYNVYYSSNARNSYVRFPDDSSKSTWFDSHNNLTNNVPIKAFTVDEHDCEYAATLINTAHGSYTSNSCIVCGSNFVSGINITTGSDVTFTLNNKNLGIEVVVPAAQFIGKSVSLYAVRDYEYDAARVVDSPDCIYVGGSLFYVALIVDGVLVSNPGCTLDVKIASPTASLEAYSLHGNRGAYTSFEKSSVSYLNGEYLFSDVSCGGFLLCTVNHNQPSDGTGNGSSQGGSTSGGSTSGGSTAGGSTPADDDGSSSTTSSGSFMEQIAAFFRKIADFFKNLFS